LAQIGRAPGRQIPKYHLGRRTSHPPVRRATCTLAIRTAVSLLGKLLTSNQMPRGFIRATESCRSFHPDPHPTRAKKIAVAVLALMLMALLGFYTLVTGRITDGPAKLRDGAGQAATGAEQLKDGAGKLSSGANKVFLDVTENLPPAPKHSKSEPVSSLPGRSRLRPTSTTNWPPASTRWTTARANSPPELPNWPPPSLLLQREMPGTTWLTAHRPLDAGAARLASGAADLAAGTGQLKGYRGTNNSPEAGTGTAALAQALELLEAAASDPLQGLVRSPPSGTRPSGTRSPR
jgi:putative membrane protein